MKKDFFRQNFAFVVILELTNLSLLLLFKLDSVDVSSFQNNNQSQLLKLFFRWKTFYIPHIILFLVLVIPSSIIIHR